MKTHTIKLHRVLRCPPVRVYNAFTQGAALCKWLPPFGFTATLHEMNPVVGGTLADVLHESHDRQGPRFRWGIP